MRCSQHSLYGCVPNCFAVEGTSSSTSSLHPAKSTCSSLHEATGATFFARQQRWAVVKNKVRLDMFYTAAATQKAQAIKRNRDFGSCPHVSALLDARRSRLSLPAHSVVDWWKLSGRYQCSPRPLSSSCFLGLVRILYGLVVGNPQKELQMGSQGRSSGCSRSSEVGSERGAADLNKVPGMA